MLVQKQDKKYSDILTYVEGCAPAAAAEIHLRKRHGWIDAGTAFVVFFISVVSVAAGGGVSGGTSTMGNTWSNALDVCSSPLVEHVFLGATTFIITATSIIHSCHRRIQPPMTYALCSIDRFRSCHIRATQASLQAWNRNLHKKQS